MQKQFFLVEARPGDEGRNEIILTVSDLSVEQTEDQPASVQPLVERAGSPRTQQEIKGREPVSWEGRSVKWAAVFPHGSKTVLEVWSG